MTQWFSQDEAKGLKTSKVSWLRQPGRISNTVQKSRKGKTKVDEDEEGYTDGYWNRCTFDVNVSNDSEALAAGLRSQFKSSGVGGRLIITLAVNI